MVFVLYDVFSVLKNNKKVNKNTRLVFIITVAIEGFYGDGVGDAEE